MNINEIVEAPAGYHSPEDDESGDYGLRKTHLTLMQINKLRKMNDIREYEQMKKIESIQIQYGPSAEEGGDGDVF